MEKCKLCKYCDDIISYKCCICDEFTPLYTIKYNNEEVDIFNIYCMYCAVLVEDFNLLDIFHGRCVNFSPKKNLYPLKLTDKCHGAVCTSEIITRIGSVDSMIDSTFNIMGYDCELCGNYTRYFVLIDKKGNIVTEQYKIDIDNVIVLCSHCGIRFNKEIVMDNIYKKGKVIENRNKDSIRIAEIYQFKLDHLVHNTS